MPTHHTQASASSGIRPASGEGAVTTAVDRAIMCRIDGLYVGMLEADEIAIFNDLCARGLMKRDYAHAGGFLGLAIARRIACTDPTPTEAEGGRR